MGYFRPLFIGIDQLINAIAGGNPDNTISARIGYYATHGSENQKKFWKAMEWMTDKTFLPLEGPGHCHIAYHADAGEDFDADKKGIGVFMLCILSLPFLILIALVLYLGSWLGLIKQVHVVRSEAIHHRLGKTVKMLQSIKKELEEQCENDPILLVDIEKVAIKVDEARNQILKCK